MYYHGKAPNEKLKVPYKPQRDYYYRNSKIEKKKQMK